MSGVTRDRWGPHCIVSWNREIIGSSTSHSLLPSRSSVKSRDVSISHHHDGWFTFELHSITMRHVLEASVQHERKYHAEVAKWCLYEGCWRGGFRCRSHICVSLFYSRNGRWLCRTIHELWHWTVRWVWCIGSVGRGLCSEREREKEPRTTSASLVDKQWFCRDTQISQFLTWFEGYGDRTLVGYR